MKKKGVMLGFFILISLIIFSSSFGFVSAWTNTGGGDHSGQNWIISSNTFVAGVHTNVGNFTIPSGIIVSVKPYDGTTYGSFEVHASNITVAGTLNASGAGYGGGGGGGGGASGCNCVISGSSSGGYGFADGSNGNSGGGSRFQQGCSENGNTNICGGATAGAGGAGGGPSGGFGGAGGTPKNNCITTNANSPWYGSLGGDGSSGRYCNTSSSNITSLCDSSSDETLRMGSGGGGAGGGGGGQTWSGNGASSTRAGRRRSRPCCWCW